MITKDMIRRAVKSLEHFLGGQKIRKSVFLGRRFVLVFEISEFYKKINPFGVHQRHTLGEFIEGFAIKTRALCIGIGIVTICNNAKSYKMTLAATAERSVAGKRCQSKTGKYRRRGLQKYPSIDHPALLVEIFAYRAAFLNDRFVV